MISLYGDNSSSAPSPAPIKLYPSYPTGPAAQAATPAPGAAPIRLYKDTPASTPAPTSPIKPAGPLSPSDGTTTVPTALPGKYGAATDKDPASGKPLLWYENPQAKSTQLLSDRTYPGFDPTKPQKINPADLQNPRMKQDVSTSLRKQFGATAFEELDHIMPLELGGSNKTSNLQREKAIDPSKPYSPGKNPTFTDALENELAHKVHNGDLTGYSLAQAWRDMAKAKGVTLPENGGPVPKANVSPASAPQPQTENPIKSTFENAITNFAPFQVLARVTGGESIFGAIKEVYGDSGQKLNAEDINGIISRREALIKNGADASKATNQAVTEAKEGKIKAQLIGSVNLEGDLADAAKAIEGIAKSANPAEIASLLKKVPGVASEDVPVLSKALKGISNPEDVKGVIASVAEKTEPVKNFTGESNPGLTGEQSQAIAQAGKEGSALAEARDAKAQAAVEARNALEEKAALAPPPELETFLQKLKNVMNPLKAQDPDVQKAFEDYSKKLTNSRQLANTEASKLRNISPEEGLDTILRYERGSQTPHTNQIRDQFESLFKEANDRGLDTEHKGNYLPHAYAETKDQIGQVMKKYLLDKGLSEDMVKQFVDGKQDLPDSVVRRLGLNPFFSKTRIFPTYDAAIEAGLHPKYTHPAQLAGFYRENMEHAIASREFVNDLVKKGKLFPADLAPTGYKPVNLEFSQQGYYAKPRLADMLNGLFNASNSKSFFQHVIGVTGKVSRTVQKLELTTGFPGTNINVHSIGQVIKEITAGDFSKVKTFIRANSKDASVKFFEENRDILQRMAAHNLDLGTTVADYPHLYDNLMKPGLSDAYARGGKTSVASFLTKETGTAFENIFTKKNFSSFMPQLYVTTFKDAAERFASQGMEQSKADELAADTVRAFHGLVGNIGRARGTEDALSTVFFAPKFRESIIDTLWNSLRSITTEISNPAFYKNRRLVGGMAFSFGLYAGANKYMNGHFMWQNPSTHQFDLQIPTGNGNYAYVPFMPTFLAVPRNLLGGVLSTAQSDLKGATEQFSSVLAAPLQLFGQLYANKDFFGRPIYADTDPGTIKAQKIAGYLGLNVVPPWIKETVNYIEKRGQVPLYQAITTGMELPLKYGSDLKNSQSDLAQAMQNYQTQHAAAINSFRPTYDKVQSLIQGGKNDEAQKLVDALSDSDYQLYKDIKAGDTRKNTSKGEAQFLPTYRQIQSLLQNGKTAEAQKALDGLSDQEYKYYQALKKRGL
jgi:hypothetical protein